VNAMMPSLAIILNYPIRNAEQVGILGKDIVSFKNPLRIFREVHVISPRSSEPMDLGDKNVYVHPVQTTARWQYYLSPLFDALALYRVVKRHDVKVIRALAPTSGFVATMVGRLTGVPVVVSVHTDQFVAARDERRSALKNVLVRLVEPFVLKRAKLVPVISGHIQRYALNMGARPETLFYHPNFVDTKLFRPQAKARGLKRILFVGRLSKVKGAEEALETLRLVLQKRKDVVLLIAGSGEQESAAKALAKRLGVEKHVQFLGSVDHERQLPRLMGSSHVFLAPLTAGFSLIEAMASGLPIVAGDIEWTREVIRTGETGVLVNAGNPAALAEGVLSVLNDPRGAERMAARVRKLACKTFSLDAWKERDLEIYRRALARTR